MSIDQYESGINIFISSRYNRPNIRGSQIRNNFYERESSQVALSNTAKDTIEKLKFFSNRDDSKYPHLIGEKVFDNSFAHLLGHSTGTPGTLGALRDNIFN